MPWSYVQKGILNDETVGPFTDVVFLGQVRVGKHKPKALVASQEMTAGNWVELQAVPTLRAAFIEGQKQREEQRADEQRQRENAAELKRADAAKKHRSSPIKCSRCGKSVGISTMLATNMSKVVAGIFVCDGCKQQIEEQENASRIKPPTMALRAAEESELRSMLNHHGQLGPPIADPLGLPTPAVAKPTAVAAPASNRPVLVLEGANGAILEILLVYTETSSGSHLGGLGFKAFTGILGGESHVTSKAICRVYFIDGSTKVLSMFMFQIEEFIEKGQFWPKL